MVQRTFIACKFREGDIREYTYHYDGSEIFNPGDKVKVPDRSGEGHKVVIVSQHLDPDFVPQFATKAIIGKAEPDGEDIGSPLDAADRTVAIARMIRPDMKKDEGNTSHE